MTAPTLTNSGKDRLREASDKLFAHRPYAEVGVAELLELAQVQAPTLYHHFEDKEGLYVDWVERALSRLGKTIESALRDKSDAFERLVALVETIGETERFDLSLILEGRARLKREASALAIERAYFSNVHSPVCLELMASQDAGLVIIDSVEKAATLLVAGARAVSSQNSTPASGADSDYKWWVSRFMFGFIRPIP